MARHHFPWTEAFLAALREMPVLAHAANACGIHRATAWNRMQADPDFKAAVEEAMEQGIDRAEQEAFRRGVVGFEEPLVHQGNITWLTEHYDRDTGEAVPDDVAEENLRKALSKDPKVRETVRNIGWRYKLDAAGQRVPLTVRKHSDALLALILKGRRKKVYADRTELTGADGGPVQQVDETAKAARVAQLMAMAQKRKSDEERFGDLA